MDAGRGAVKTGVTQRHRAKPTQCSADLEQRWAFGPSVREVVALRHGSWRRPAAAEELMPLRLEELGKRADTSIRTQIVGVAGLAGLALDLAG